MNFGQNQKHWLARFSGMWWRHHDVTSFVFKSCSWFLSVWEMVLFVKIGQPYSIFWAYDFSAIWTIWLILVKNHSFIKWDWIDQFWQIIQFLKRLDQVETNCSIIIRSFFYKRCDFMMTSSYSRKTGQSILQNLIPRPQISL